MRAVGPNIIVRNIPRETQRASGIQVPTGAGDKKISKGYVLSVGSLVNQDLGGDTIHPGMVVAYDTYSANEVENETGQVKHLIPARGLYGIDEDHPETTFSGELQSEAKLLKG